MYGNNITVFAFQSHTHTAAKSVYTKIVKNGIETGYLAKNQYFNPNYQNTVILNNFINITQVFLIFGLLQIKNMQFLKVSTN